MNDKKAFINMLAPRLLTLVHTVLIFAVTIILLFTLGMLLLDLYKAVSTKFSEGMGTVLGSLLIVWVVLELLEAQIDNLNGKKLNASLFIIVAIVAFIKKLLIAALLPEQVEYAYFTLAVILVLTITYVILRFAETRLTNTSD